MQCLAQLDTTHQQDKEPGEGVVNLRVGDPLGRALPRSNACPMITVIGQIPALAKLGMERDHADEQHRTENSEDDRRPHTRLLEFRPQRKWSLQLKGPSSELDGPLLAHSHESNPYMNFINLSFASSIT